MFHEDAVTSMTYNLGGSVAIDADGTLFRAPDETIVLALEKAERLGVIQYVAGDDWLKMYAGHPGLIQAVAQRVVDVGREGSLCEHDEYNLVFCEHEKMQSEWEAHSMQILQLKKRKERMLLEYRDEDMHQKQRNKLRLLQIIQQEKVRQQRLHDEIGARRSTEMKALEEECEDQEEVGRRIRERRHVIDMHLRRILEKDGEDEDAITQHSVFY